MPNINEIQKAADDGTLENAEMSFCIECRREMDRLVNANSLIQPQRKLLSERVEKRISALQQRELNAKSDAALQKMHAEKIALNQEAIVVSREALGISKEANKISVDSNVISNTANAISKKANNLSRAAVFVACLALLCSLGQCVNTWWPRPMQSSPSSTPGTAPPTQVAPILPGPAAQTSNSTSTASTIHTPTNTPATNNP